MPLVRPVSVKATGLLAASGPPRAVTSWPGWLSGSGTATVEPPDRPTRGGAAAETPVPRSSLSVPEAGTVVCGVNEMAADEGDRVVLGAIAIEKLVRYVSTIATLTLPFSKAYMLLS